MPLAGRWQNDYATLDERLFARVTPTPTREPNLLMFNHHLATALGLSHEIADEAQPLRDTDTTAQSPEWTSTLAGQTPVPDITPIAQAYAGHQYAHFTMLGDGRAHLIGECLRPDGRVVDIQLKGSGPTPFSRRGDGRATLAAMLREYLLSECLHALGIPSTRSLAVVTTGETVWRDRAHPGAVLTRVAASHLRVGTFEYAAALDRQNATEPPGGELPNSPLVRQLADFAIGRHDPDLIESGPQRFNRLLDRVIERQARLVADWMAVGFVHGVMNTDNTTISGETIDYGPCAFLDVYRPEQTFSSIDVNGRYAYANQPYVLHWNLARFAETLLPLLDRNAERAMARAHEALNRFPTLYAARLRQHFRRKLALDLPAVAAHLTATTPSHPLSDHRPERAHTAIDADAGIDDDRLIERFLDAMARDQADFTLSFRQLAYAARDDGEPLRNPFEPGTHLADWWPDWAQRVEGVEAAHLRAALNRANPARIARNHLVEQALKRAETGDLDAFETLLDGLRAPSVTRPEWALLDRAPKADERITQTFCGT